MKPIYVLLATLALLLSQFAHAYTDPTIREINETLQRFGTCNDDGYEVRDLDAFKVMFANLEKNMKSSTVEITDYNYDNVTLVDSATGQTCTLYTDIYEGRCNYAICN